VTITTWCRAALLVLLAAIARGAGLAAQTATAHHSLSVPPIIEIQRVAEPPRLGAFTAPWSTARPADVMPIADFRQRKPGDGVPVSQRTTAYVSYDDANLYVVFVCQDDPAKVRANVTRREDIGDDDQVAVFLVQRDGIFTEGQSEDLSFDAVWRSEGQVTDSGYVVRFAIPFRSLRFSRDSVQTWGIALQRVIQRTNEEAYWPHLTKRVKGLVPQFAPARGLAGIAPGRNAQATPYSMLARARVLDDDLPGHVAQGDERVGMDAKAVLRGAFTLDATVNPDFSQVETDDPQVTVNRRFEVFFPEKRPFFLENAGFFQTPVNLLFSRRIVDPGAGLRFTGKAGRWAVGALAMNDRAAVPSYDPAAGLDTWVGAVRVQRDLAKESTVGILVTDREFVQSFKADRMFSADARWRAGDNWSVTAQVMRSETVEHEGARSAGWGVLGDISFESRNVDYSGKYEEFGPDFTAPLGFVSRAGFRRTDQQVEYAFRPKAGPVTTYAPALSVNAFWDHATGRLLDREIEARFQTELLGNTDFQVTRIQAFELFDDVGFDPHLTQAEFSTEWIKWLGLDVTYAWGTAVNHDPAEGRLAALERASETEVGVKIRPTPRLRLEQSYTYAELRAADGSRIVSERQLRSKLNYQFTPRLSLRANVDWKASDADTTLADEDPRERRWGLDVLLTYLAHPGTALYLGYTDRYENWAILPGSPRQLVPSRSPDMSVGRQIFLKASYLLRY